jgi:septal ring factor EnvC (AmiA/AmiB activator)
MPPQPPDIAAAAVRRAHGPCRAALACLPAFWLALAISSDAGAAAHAAAPASSASTRAQLKSVRSQISREKQQAGREARQRERLTAQLRAVELSLEKSRSELERIDNQISDYEARRTATVAAQARQDRALEAARTELGAELRAAYRRRQSSPLELWLSARSVLAAQRLLAYDGYFARADTTRIANLAAQVRQLGGVAAQLTQQQSELSALKQSQEQTQQQLGRERDQRQQVLQQLASAAHTRSERLARLTSEQSELERVLRQLGRSALAPSGAAPNVADSSSVFGRLRGQLSWPVQGWIAASFGDQRASGLPWDGMVITTARDSPVRAVSSGRVAYADWLPGMGLLVIVDHGEGYLSLYGHNDRLFKPVGSVVSAGDVIAAAGDTGGRAEPELYFEIRRGGRPVDPRPWFKTPQPASP